VITAVLVKEQGASSGPSLATPGIDILPHATQMELAVAPVVAIQTPKAAEAAASPPKLSDEEIAALVAGGRQLIVAGDIPNARLVLQHAAEAGNSTAALELGATYDPFILQLPGRAGSTPVSAQMPSVSAQTRRVVADIAMAKAWYEKAMDLGSTEAAVRLEKLRNVLEKLRNVPGPGR
jgi:hypothetical protein